MKKSICSFVCAFFLSLTVNAQNYKLEGNQVTIDQPIVFETGSSILKPESDAALKIIKKYLDDKPYISLLRVEAHTDPTSAVNSAHADSTCRPSSLLARAAQDLTRAGSTSLHLPSNSSK